MARKEIGFFMGSVAAIGFAALGLYDGLHNLPELRADIINTTPPCSSLVGMSYATIEKRAQSLLDSQKTLEELAASVDSRNLIDCYRFAEKRSNFYNIQVDGLRNDIEITATVISLVMGVGLLVGGVDIRNSRIKAQRHSK